MLEKSLKNLPSSLKGKNTDLSQIKIYCRDKLLSKEIIPRITKKKGFTLMGQPGIGKTVLLKWAFLHYEGKKVIISAKEDYKQILISICQWIDDQDLKRVESMKIPDLEAAIVLTKNEIALFVDDFEKVKDKFILLLKNLKEKRMHRIQYPLFCATRGEIKDELKRLRWEGKHIHLQPIEKTQRHQFIQTLALQMGKVIDTFEIDHVSRGIPERVVSAINGEVLKEDFDYVEEEEINIGWILLFIALFLVCLRYVGVGLSDRELYLIGGIGTGSLLFIRLFAFKMMKR